MLAPLSLLILRPLDPSCLPSSSAYHYENRGALKLLGVSPGGAYLQGSREVSGTFTIRVTERKDSWEIVLSGGIQVCLAIQHLLEEKKGTTIYCVPFDAGQSNLI